MLGVPAALHSAEIEAWYGNRLSPDYRGRTAEEIREIFGHFGLDKMCLHMEGPCVDQGVSESPGGGLVLMGSN